MEGNRVAVIEIFVGLFFIIIGFISWWWSAQLLWILIYPPPLAKWIIESLPFVFWGLGALLIIDGVRRREKG
jgi:hypothetical protein